MKNKIPTFIVVLILSQNLFSQIYNDIINQLDIQEGSNVSFDNWGSGVSFFDFNKDGWDDLTFTMENDTQLFFINNEGSYEKINFQIYNEGRVKHLMWIDYDNDDDLDILLSIYNGKCYLYQNDGDFNFIDVTESAGLYNFAAKNFGVSAADYNKDGFLDIFVARYELADNGIQPSRNILYKNNGDGTFTDVSEFTGITEDLALSFMGVWLDYNNDNWPDLYVINDRSNGNNMLYRNNADGTFTDVAQNAGVGMNGEDPMTASVADFDNDGDLDIFLTNTGIFSFLIPKLYENNGDGTFLERANYYQVDFDSTSWGGVWLDYNNDGFQDLYVATSFLNSSIPPIRNYFFKNNFPNPFTDITKTTFIGNHVSKSYSVAKGDINNDGYADIVVHNVEPHKPFLWLNTGGDKNFIKITLKGIYSNKMAIGSWVKVYSGNNMFTKYTQCGENYIGQSTQNLIFGLDTIDIIDSLIIEYPSGIIDKYFNLVANERYILTEGETLKPIINYNSDINPCSGDTLFLNVENYDLVEWNNQFLTDSIMVFEPGKYWATSSKFGFNFTSDTIDIQFIESPNLLIQKSQPSCFNGDDGAINLELVNYDSDNFLINWNDDKDSLSIENLTSGIYFFEFIDSNNCILRDTIELGMPNEINLQLLTTQYLSSNFSRLDFLINGGTPPYQVFLNDEIVNSDVVDSLLPGTYIFKVIDFNNCSYLETLIINENEITSISNSLNNKFIVFPNPANDFLIINFYNDDLLSIDLYSMDGRKILETQKNTINTQNLSSGSYLLNITTKNNIFSVIIYVKK